MDVQPLKGQIRVCNVVVVRIPGLINDVFSGII